MKNLKKVLALVTMFTMLLSVAVSAGALYPDVEDNASYAEAVETLNVLGIMIGDEKGNFNPDASITRAETAAIVTRMRALGNAAGATGGTNFTDVAADHWAAGYINLAEQSGIINGYGDGTFGPSDAVTYEQVIKMIVAALGRTPEANSKGGYPSGYMIVAAQEDITAGVSVTAGAEAPRAAVARLVFNALEVDVMEQKDFTPGEEKFEIKKNTTLLKDYLKVDRYEGVIGSTYISKADIDGEATIIMDCSKINEVSYAVGKEESVTLYEGDTDAAAFLGFNVSAYAKENDDDKMVLLGVAKKASKNEVLELTYDDIDSVAIGGETVTINYLKNASSSRTEQAVLSIPYLEFFNNAAAGSEIDEFFDAVKTKAGSDAILTLISNDGKEGYEVAMLKEANGGDFVVGEVDAEEFVLTDRKGDVIDVFDMTDETQLVKFFNADGTPAAFADLKEGNIITIYADAEEKIFSVYISDVKIEGKVTEESKLSNGDYVYKIGDDNYRTLVSLTPGDEGTFFVNVEGKIVDKVATAASGEYAYLYKAGLMQDGFTDTIQLKYLTTSGEWVLNSLATKVTVINDGKTAVTLNMAELGTKGAAFETALEGFAAVTKEQNKDKDNKPVEGSYKVTGVAAGSEPVFQFGLNSEGLINKLYIGINGGDEYISRDYNAGGAERDYNADDKSLGGVNFNDETPIFSVKASVTDEDDIVATKASALFIDRASYLVEAFDVENDVPAVAVITNTSSPVLGGTKLLVITKKAEVANATGGKDTKIYGIQEGEEVSALLAEGCEIVDVDEKDTSVNVGDVAIFSLDANGNIDNLRILLAYADAKAAIEANKAIEIKSDDDDAENFFGYVDSKDGGKFLLTDAFEGSVLENEGDAVKFALTGTKANVYEINISKDAPSFDVISASKIKATQLSDKEAHWAYVRYYNEKLVDVVVYKMVTTQLEVEITVAEDGKATIKATDGATVKYQIGDEDEKDYKGAFALTDGQTVKATATKNGYFAAEDTATYTAPVVESTPSESPVGA